VYWCCLDPKGKIVKRKMYLKFITKKLMNVTKEDKKLFYDNRSDFKQQLTDLNYDIIIINATELEAKFVKDLVDELLNEVSKSSNLIY